MTTHEPEPAATGPTMRWARYYDLGFNIFTLGRARALRQMTVTLAEIAAGDVVLDVGCGTGALTMAAGRVVGATGHVHGIDPSPDMIAVARRKATRSDAPIDYQIASVAALPFPDGTFDAVVNCLVMHHLLDDLKHRAVTEMRRVLRPGGRLLIVDFRRSKGHGGHLPNVIHRHHHGGDAHDLSGLLKSAGFSEVEVGDTNVGFLGFARGRAGCAAAASAQGLEERPRR
jgi:ubiquinone/menaquinone biosynthesis C-methylase UbiE